MGADATPRVRSNVTPEHTRQEDTDGLTPALRAEFAFSVEWFVYLRWVALFGILVVSLLVRFLLPIELNVVPIAVTAVLIAVYNGSLHLWLAGQSGYVVERSLRLLVNLQIIIDLLLLTLLMHFAGGAENPFLLFYVFHMIIGSIFLPRRTSLVYAAYASVLLATLLGFEALGIIPHMHLGGFVAPALYRDGLYISVLVSALVITFFLVVYMTSVIAGHLRLSNAELLKAQLALQDQARLYRETNEKLQKMARGKSAPLMRVAHEIRSPLASIRSFMDVILQGYAKDGELSVEEMLESARDRATDLLSLVDDLLYLGEIKVVGAIEENHPIDLAEVLKNVLSVLKGGATEKHVALYQQVDPDLPPVCSTKEFVKELLYNLIDNGIKYTPSGGTVSVSLRTDGKFIFGEVADSGIGIPLESLPMVFDEYYRAPNAIAIQKRGTGLGLPIVKRIVELSGGEIGVKSELGKGTVFEFWLPAAKSGEGAH